MESCALPRSVSEASAAITPETMLELACDGRIELVGICDSNAETARRASGEHALREFLPIGASYSEGRCRFDRDTDRERIAEIACAFLEKGVHALVENRSALTLAEADKMIAAAAASAQN